ncbi:ATP-binding cassette domain-containing protein [Pyrobaculum sp.]|uniref:ATP-binding cassette domain-containing protein n=1 Tax=Pyrobaculum sp. TaxID=2004705 RepID=UPI003D0F8CF3
MNAASPAATRGGGVKSYWHYALGFAKRYWVDEAVIFSLWGAMIILGVAQVLLIKQIVDEVVYGAGDAGTLVFQISAVVGIAFLIPILNFLSEYRAAVWAQRAIIDVSHRIVHSVVLSPAHNRGEALSRISGDVLNVVLYLALPLDVALQAARFIAVVAASLYISPEITLFVAPLIALYFLVAKKLGPPILEWGRRERELYSQWFRRVKEVVDGAHSLYRAGVRALPKILLEASEKWLAGYKKYGLYSKSLGFGANAITFGVPNLAFGLGLLLSLQGAATVGTAVAMRTLLAEAFEPLAQIMMKSGSYYQLKRSFERVAPYLDTVVTEAPARGEAPIVKVEKVTLGYDGNVVLRGVDLVFVPGDFVWVRGPTGGGKSTLGKALAGLVKPLEGEIETPRAIYVGNDDYIFDASVWENITLWEEFPEEEVRRAAELAQIDFPLDKKCGEGGSELSEGQRQRVLLARAFLRRPHVLVLDEVTSGLNQEVEERVLDALRRVVPIAVVISHRQTPARYATKIVEVSGGAARLVEARPLLSSTS